jgi:hypothetical protein
MNVSSTIEAAFDGRTEARLIAAPGKVPEAWHTTSVARWYNEPAAGSTYDDSPQGQGKNKCDEKMTVLMSGGLVSATAINSLFTPHGASKRKAWTESCCRICADGLVSVSIIEMSSQ